MSKDFEFSRLVEDLSRRNVVYCGPEAGLANEEETMYFALVISREEHSSILSELSVRLEKHLEHLPEKLVFADPRTCHADSCLAALTMAEKETIKYSRSPKFKYV
jgi:hypothetical protein